MPFNGLELVTSLLALSDQAWSDRIQLFCNAWTIFENESEIFLLMLSSVNQYSYEDFVDKLTKISRTKEK